MNSIPSVNDKAYVLNAEFVKLTLNLAAGGTEVVTFSSSYRNETIDGVEYLALGGLLGIGSQQRDLSATGYDTSVSLIGIDSQNIFYVLSDEFLIKGSTVQIFRGFYDSAYNLTPVLRYTGIVTSWSIEETLNMGDFENLSDTYVCTFNCSNYKTVIENRVSGRNTNPTSWRQFYPTDTSMDNVPSLVGANWDFGVPKK